MELEAQRGGAAAAEPEPQQGHAAAAEPEPQPGRAAAAEPEFQQGRAAAAEPETQQGHAAAAEPEPQPGRAAAAEPELQQGRAAAAEPETQQGGPTAAEPGTREGVGRDIAGHAAAAEPEPQPGRAATAEPELQQGHAAAAEPEPQPGRAANNEEPELQQGHAATAEPETQQGDPTAAEPGTWQGHAATAAEPGPQEGRVAAEEPGTRRAPATEEPETQQGRAPAAEPETQQGQQGHAAAVEPDAQQDHAPAAEPETQQGHTAAVEPDAQQDPSPAAAEPEAQQVRAAAVEPDAQQDRAPAAEPEAQQGRAAADRDAAKCAKWRFYDSLFLCKDGDEAPYRGKALFLDRAIASVRAAAEGLTMGQIACADDFCVVFSDAHQEFHVLHRPGRRQAAVDALGLRDATQDGLAEGDGPAAAAPYTYEELLEEFENACEWTVQLEDMVRQAAEAGQVLLARNEELAQDNRRHEGEEEQQVDASLAEEEVRELHRQNEELLKQLELLQEEDAAGNGDGKVSGPPSFALGERESPQAILRKMYDESTREWEEHLQREVAKRRELQEQHEQLSREHEHMKMEHNQLLESERTMQQALGKLMVQTSKKCNRPQERKSVSKRPSRIGRLSRVSVSSSPGKLDELVALRGENDEIGEENARLRGQLAELEVRCSGLEVAAERRRQVLASQEQEREDLKAASDELQRKLQDAKKERLQLPVHRRSPHSHALESVMLDTQFHSPVAKQPLLGVGEEDTGVLQPPIQLSMYAGGGPARVGERRVLCHCPCACVRLCVLSSDKGAREAVDPRRQGS